MCQRTDAITVFTFIKRLCAEGNLFEALSVLEEIGSGKKQHVISAEVFLEVLRGCFRNKDLEAGRRARSLMIRCGLDTDLLLGNHLIRLFSTAGNLSEALQQFQSIPNKDEYAWNTIISAHAKHKKEREALMLYHEMLLSTVKPDAFTYTAVLKACASIGFLEQGRAIHSCVIDRGLEHDMLVGNAIIDMYCKCGSLLEARKVFDNLTERDRVSWNAMIAGCVKHKKDAEAFQLYDQMQDEGIKPDTVTYLFMLKACARMGALDQGRAMHIRLTKSGLGNEQILVSNLIDMYVKCGSLKEARRVFDSFGNHDIFVWTSMIVGYAEQSLGQEVLHLFKAMLRAGIKPDRVIFVSVLKAFSKCEALKMGKLVHTHILEGKLESDVYVASSLIGMYARCGGIDDAHKVFMKLPQRDLILWNTMINGFLQHERGQDALKLFEKMQKGGIKPDNFTFSSIFKACGSILALDQGRLIHKQLVETGYDFDLVVGNSLIDMYVKCRCIDEAVQVFSSLSDRNVVSWTTMIGGFAEIGNSQEAFTFFKKMQEAGLRPNMVTYLCALKACSSVSALSYGKSIHAQLVEDGFDADPVIGNALVNMYAKCGSLNEAGEIFLRLPRRDVVSWNVMIDACAQQGYGKEALNLFEGMHQDGVIPNEATFVSVLVACSHTGLVSQGCSLFTYMQKTLGIKPDMNHYSCMVDLFGRSGQLHEAYNFIRTMPIQPSVVVWMTLLGACRTHRNLELGKISLEAILQLEPTNAPAHSLMFNICDSLGDRSMNEEHIGQ